MRFAEAIAGLERALAVRVADVRSPDDPGWPAPLRHAAVMVLVRDRGGEAMVPMIVRGADAPVHAAQAALPGGRREPSDATLTVTALREVEEELGVAPARVRVLGELDDLPTRTGFLVRPVVGVLTGDDAFRPDPREVQEVFEAPLAAFRDRAIAEALGIREVGGVRYPLRAYQAAERRVWGVAARVLEVVAALAAGEDPGTE